MGTAPYTPGGLSNSKLKLADAETCNVKSGKKFYAGDKTLKTGTWVPRLKKLTSGSWNGDGTRSLSVRGYSVYYFIYDDYDNSDGANKNKSQGTWGLVLNGGGMVLAECYGCNPDTTTTFSITYYHTGGYGRSASVYAIP